MVKTPRRSRNQPECARPRARPRAQQYGTANGVRAILSTRVCRSSCGRRRPHSERFALPVSNAEEQSAAKDHPALKRNEFRAPKNQRRLRRIGQILIECNSALLWLRLRRAAAPPSETAAGAGVSGRRLPFLPVRKGHFVQ